MKKNIDELKLFNRLVSEYREDIRIAVNSQSKMREHIAHYIGLKSWIRIVIDDLFEEKEIDLKYIYLLDNILGFFQIKILSDECEYYNLVKNDVFKYYQELKNIWDKVEHIDNSLLAINTTVAIINLKLYDRKFEFENKFKLNYRFSLEEVNKVIAIINSDKLEDFYNLFTKLIKRMIDKDFQKYLKKNIICNLKKILDERNKV